LAVAGLIKGIETLPNRLASARKGTIHLPRALYTSGFVAVLAAFLKQNKVAPGTLAFHHESNTGYFRAIGLSRAVWGVDDYRLKRKNAAINYAPLTHLDSREAVDSATGQINSCLRKMAKSASYTDSPSFIELTKVVGELHDNVWSHGLDSGFSTAQRRQAPDGIGWLLEFALADCGMGFYNELRRARIPNVNTHQQAIEWCIQEGNSSKLAVQEDPWAQSVPEDFIGRSPFGPSIGTFVNRGSHHQGLGLAKLLALAKRYDGTLYLATGDSYLHLHNGESSYHRLSTDWKGVAVSLTLKESNLIADQRPDETDDLADFMNLLRG